MLSIIVETKASHAEYSGYAIVLNPVIRRMANDAKLRTKKSIDIFLKDLLFNFRNINNLVKG